MTDDSSIRVLYIAGWARSGSTIVGHVLGQARGIFFGGELFNLAERGWRRNDLCGCGRPFLQCPIWSKVMRGVQRRIQPGDLERAEGFGSRLMRTRDLPSVFVRRRGVLGSPEQAAITRMLTALFSEIKGVSGAEVIVDSSKSPVFADALDRSPGFEVSILHLVRDPRATGFSLRRLKFDPGSRRPLKQRGPITNAAVWDVWNAAIELLWARRRRPSRYLRLRYEDFARDPASAIRSVGEFLGHRDRKADLMDGSTLHLSPTHSVSGNPSRFLTGAVEIRPDDEWRAGMSRSEKGLTTLLTWPGLLRYGYPLIT